MSDVFHIQKSKMNGATFVGTDVLGCPLTAGQKRHV